MSYIFQSNPSIVKLETRLFDFLNSESCNIFLVNFKREIFFL